MITHDELLGCTAAIERDGEQGFCQWPVGWAAIAYQSLKLQRRIRSPGEGRRRRDARRNAVCEHALPRWLLVGKTSRSHFSAQPTRCRRCSRVRCSFVRWLLC
jgi:hypothetical protein